MRLLMLPRDVITIIWTFLNLHDLARVRQTCWTLTNTISSDKQLWVYIFNRDVKARSLCIPYNLRDVKDVEARDIEAWVKHACLLDRAYRTPDISLSIRRLTIRPGLRVTWLKLILGHWCLVAAANDDMSELMLWEFESQNRSKLVAKTYLHGPVMDGILDISTDEVRNTYILILGVYELTEGVVFRELGKIAGASHVQFFRGNLVGFAVRNGDDAYPYLANWRAGTLYYLRNPRNYLSRNISPLPIKPCRAITVRYGFIFTLHDGAVHVFKEPTSLSGVHPTHISALPRQWLDACGRFSDLMPMGSYSECGVEMVHILYQNMRSEIGQAAVAYDARQRDHDAFKLEESGIKGPPNLPFVRSLHLCQLGSCGKVLFCATSLHRRAWWHPSISFAILREDESDSSVKSLRVDGEYIPISRRGLPLLHALSSVDFDDGNGILLMGTFTGEVRVASVLSNPIIPAVSVRSDLGQWSGLEPECKVIHDEQVDLELPLFYRIRKDYELYDPLPQGLISEASSDWGTPSIGMLSFANWTNDWTRFECVWDWLLPLSRWGPLEKDFLDITTTTRVRNRLQTLGEIIPVLYSADNHHEVLFRIGQRLFYCRMIRDDGDEDNMSDFEWHPEGILCVLPITYDQFLNEPESILGPLTQDGILRDLETWMCPDGLSQRMYIAEVYYGIQKHWEVTRGTSLSSEAMVCWSNDELDANAFAALESESSDYEEPSPP